MRVGRVVNPSHAQVPDVLLVFVDLAVAAWQVQCDLGHVVNAHVADVPYGNARVGVALLDLKKSFGRAEARGGANADVLSTELLQEQKLIVSRRSGCLGAELDAWLAWMNRCFALAREQARTKSAAHRYLAEIAPAHTRCGALSAHIAFRLHAIASFRTGEHQGTRYSFRQTLYNNRRCWKLKKLGRGDELRPMFLQAVTDCMAANERVK